tara:strand:- start:24 stop:554 length:531 start_codon:yes stop_codon:yes gene_type:complete
MNKIIVSIVLAITLILAINKVADVVYYVEKPEKSAYQIVNVATATSTGTSEASSGDIATGDILALLASANVADGEKVFKKCTACHSIAKGGANKIGPALWGVMGRKIGSVPGYKYSSAMAGYGKSWSFKEMDGFLLKPKDWIKGTKMSFAGLKNEKDRAAIILYLNQNTDSPLEIK